MYVIPVSMFALFLGVQFAIAAPVMGLMLLKGLPKENPND